MLRLIPLFLLTSLAAFALNTVNDPVNPAILGTCTAALHDRYAVPAPDGNRYRAWHPPQVYVDPANPSAGACRFAHEHGDNPKSSAANAVMPAGHGRYQTCRLHLSARSVASGQ